ncbi:chemotaxis protein CheA [Candidatus Gracilibacteria bacterium]|nr:chemotaxis protein CheA [Candidatus Gracilibacteria bacterium]
MDLSKFKELYISEVETQIQKLNDNLLALEKTPEEKSILNDLMRSSHTIKGSSATMSYNHMATLSHVLEDIFDNARKGTLALSKGIMNELFNGFDALEKSLSAIKDTGVELDSTELSEKIKVLCTDSTKKVVSKVAAKTPTAPTKETDDFNEAFLNKDQTIDEISRVKVPIHRLDDLMDITEELLVNKMRIESLSAGLIDPKTAKSALIELKPAVEQLSRLVMDLQFNVLQARLVPLEQIFSRFPRMVRDLAQKQNKEIELKINGSEIELDRTIVDKLGGPIIHLLRNAIDHGIEQKGTISITAKHQKDYITLVIEDDGRGIDWDKVITSAIESNIISSEEGTKLKTSKNQKGMEKLLFDPRLSTKGEVTEISGRGVGLSAVQQFVEEISGRIIIKSPLEEGSGTRFTLELPLTLAIIDALLVRVKDQTMAIPFSSIERTVHVEQKDIKTIADHETAIVAGTDVPLIRLEQVFKDTFAKEDEKEQKDGPITVVLVKRGKEVAGIVVDELLAQQEIIIKPLPQTLSTIKGFAGSTILGDGRTVLILDLVSLLSYISGH